jgi:hypothetical protein
VQEILGRCLYIFKVQLLLFIYLGGAPGYAAGEDSCSSQAETVKASEAHSHTHERYRQREYKLKNCSTNLSSR